MISAAVKIDDFAFGTGSYRNFFGTNAVIPKVKIPITKNDWRQEFKYANKLAAGVRNFISLKKFKCKKCKIL